jgi:hypothetical protein
MSDTTHITPVARKSISERFWDVITSATFVGLIIFAFSLAGIGTLIYAVVKTLGPSSANFGLPILALLSVLLLLGALLIFTTLIHTIGLSDKGSALGLPEGSVRALLALALLGLFAVLAASVLVNPSTDEFGKQMLTLVGTLMTAVISFYFGSATTSVSTTSLATPSSAAVSASGAPETSLTGISPTRAQKGTSRTYTIAGKGLAKVRKVEALAPGGGPPVPAASSNSTDSAVTFDFSFPGTGRWTMQITVGSAEPIPVPGVIEVTDF